MNPFAHTEEVAIELSNMCNLAHFHKKCPLHWQMATPYQMRDPVFLPTYLVKSVLRSLARYNFSGVLEFHRYNEPLIDPRLFPFVREAKRLLPETRIRIFTNGVFLTRGLAYELKRAGVSRITVSLYGSEKEQALTQEQLASISGLDFASGCHDDRADLYKRKLLRVHRPCGAPLRQVIVTCRGQVGLCCIDWKDKQTFGDLRATPLETILASDKVQETYRRLQDGDRDFYPCNRCAVKR